MCALMFAQRGLKVRIIESRDDFRKEAKAGADEVDSVTGKLRNTIKRSINLALSYRGIKALERVNLFEKVKDTLIEMKGRCVHDMRGNIELQPYGTGDQAIYSISRADLNRLLLDELDKHPNVEMLFDCKVKNVKPDGTVVTADDKQLPSRFVVGADGAYSTVREFLRRNGRVDFSMQYITHGYKELTIPAKEGQFALDKPHGLHIWPRQEFMLIGLPNPDKSFTCTLFAPFEGPEGLDSIKTPEQVMAYFKKYFPDAIPLMPDLINDFLTSPASPLLTVRCKPWNLKDKIVLIGDAAHACVPFYGQGMNAAFEDCLFFDELFEKHKGDQAAAITEFNQVRQPAGEALGELSLENYVEMRAKTASRLFVWKKKLDTLLHKLFPSRWSVLYHDVAFSRTQYDEALKKAQKQDRLLSTVALLAGVTAVGVGAAALYKGYRNSDSSSASSQTGWLSRTTGSIGQGLSSVAGLIGRGASAVSSVFWTSASSSSSPSAAVKPVVAK